MSTPYPIPTPPRYLYDQMGSLVPNTRGDWGSIVLGMTFRLTSSQAKSAWTGSAYGMKVYRWPGYAGPYTGSLWESSSKALLGFCVFDSGSGTGWLSQSFNPQISLSMDTTYIVAYYTLSTGSYSQSFNSVPWTSNSIWNPLYTPVLAGCYRYTGSISSSAGLTFPATGSQQTWYGMDVIISGSELTYSSSFDTYGLPVVGTRAVGGFIRGLCMGHGSADGNTPLGKYYEVGVTKSMSEGISSAPSLCLQYPGSWRFRWEVKKGTRKISVKSKQSGSTIGYTPTLTVWSNPSIGIPSNISASADESLSWTTIGPITIQPTVSGVVWVELRNNDTYHFLSPAYFDNIVAS